LLGYATRIDKIKVNCNFYHQQQGRKTLKTTVLLYLLLLALPSTSYATNTEGQSSIMVTLPPLAGLVTWLAPTLKIQCLLPNNADPHHFQLTPRQVGSFQHTSMLIRSPRDDKFWPLVNKNSPTLNLWDIPSDDDHEEQHEGNHAWLNPQAVGLELPKLAHELSQNFPAHKQEIQQQLIIALKQTQQIWQQWQDVVTESHLKASGIMMQHPSWLNLFKALNVPVRDVLESEQHGQEFGPKKLEEAMSILQQQPNTILIGDINHSNRALQWLDKYNNSPIIKLDALGQCGESWVSLMQRNLSIFKKMTASQP